MVLIHAWSQFNCGLCTAPRVSQTICGNAKIQLVIYMDDNTIDGKLQAEVNRTCPAFNVPSGKPEVDYQQQEIYSMSIPKYTISRNDGEFNS